ncbi:hypothetical protein FFLO_06445 [Filobasidium floriforme]|uniref:Uncharacterized protein n=1 Tax=Filobasidium floriforme TaxID=5210 RepID=A0A8K0JKI6_9TREE|nr:hypothetical protein FFLO_06445 [Filobasidium floriforme]
MPRRRNVPHPLRSRSPIPPTSSRAPGDYTFPVHAPSRFDLVNLNLTKKQYQGRWG